MSINSLTAQEGTSHVIQCDDNNNHFFFNTSINWYDEEGNVVPNRFLDLRFTNISRNNASTYTCRVTRDEQMLSDSVTIVVLCECIDSKEALSDSHA